MRDSISHRLEEHFSVRFSKRLQAVSFPSAAFLPLMDLATLVDNIVEPSCDGRQKTLGNRPDLKW